MSGHLTFGRYCVGLPALHTQRVDWIELKTASDFMTDRVAGLRCSGLIVSLAFQLRLARSCPSSSLTLLNSIIKPSSFTLARVAERTSLAR